MSDIQSVFVEETFNISQVSADGCEMRDGCEVRDADEAPDAGRRSVYCKAVQSLTSMGIGITCNAKEAPFRDSVESRPCHDYTLTSTRTREHEYS